MSDQDSADPDGSRLDELNYDDCMSRLASRQVDHLAVVVGHYPQVFPVNYRLDDDVSCSALISAPHFWPPTTPTSAFTSNTLTTPPTAGGAC